MTGTFEKISSTRTHDLGIYLKEDRYNDVKDSFKLCARIALSDFPLSTDKTIADIGCATGEFLHFAGSLAKDAKLVGVDVVASFLERARERVAGATFQIGSAEDKGALAPSSADVLFMIGTHSIFDDIALILDNLVTWTKPNGRVCLFGRFNANPVDVLVRVRSAAAGPQDPFERGWNLFSLATVEKHLLANPRVQSVRHELFQLTVDVAKTEADPMRKWTEIINGERRQRDGTGALVTQYCIVAQMKDA